MHHDKSEADIGNTANECQQRQIIYSCKYIHVSSPMAIEMGHLDCAKWLVDVAGLQVASIEDWIYRTPFYAACETGNIECAKWLIEIGGTSDIRKPSFNTTPMAAARVQHAKEGNYQF